MSVRRGITASSPRNTRSAAAFRSGVAVTSAAKTSFMQSFGIPATFLVEIDAEFLPKDVFGDIAGIAAIASQLQVLTETWITIPHSIR